MPLLRWCLLPRIRSFTIDTDLHGLKSEANTGPYKIESLRIVNSLWYFVYSDLFGAVIPELRLLTTLELPMLGCKYIHRRPNEGRLFTLDGEHFSPRDIRSCLAPTARSLQHLSIVSAEHIILLSHNGSVLNLSKFKHLTKVKPSACLFGARPLNPA